MPVTFDIEALGDLDVPLPALSATPAERGSFWAAWESASLDKRADYLHPDPGPYPMFDWSDDEWRRRRGAPENVQPPEYEYEDRLEREDDGND